MFLVNYLFLINSFLGVERGEPESTQYVGHYSMYCTMYGEYGVADEMSTGRGNGSTGRKPIPLPHCPPQILHELTWDRTRVAAVQSQRLTA
jgi:hypothetical protein